MIVIEQHITSEAVVVLRGGHIVVDHQYRNAGRPDERGPHALVRRVKHEDTTVLRRLGHALQSLLNVFIRDGKFVSVDDESRHDAPSIGAAGVLPPAVSDLIVRGASGVGVAPSAPASDAIYGDAR